jgi:hypothetical protein
MGSHILKHDQSRYVLKIKDFSRISGDRFFDLSCLRVIGKAKGRLMKTSNTEPSAQSVLILDTQQFESAF